MRTIYSQAQAITSTEQLLAGAAQVQATFNAPATQANVTVPQPAAAAPAVVAAPQAAAPPAPTCQHGEMSYVTSKPGANKAWKAWMCNAEKGDPTKCEPQWIR